VYARARVCVCVCVVCVCACVCVCVCVCVCEGEIFTCRPRRQDTHFVLSAIGSNAAGRDALLSFMKTNWATILRLFGGGQFLFSSIVGSCTSNFDRQAAMCAACVSVCLRLWF
jgi:hypothetical protein